MIGAGIGEALKRLGLKLPLLRRGLRLMGKTEPEAVRPPELKWSVSRNWLLFAGCFGEMVGLGMVWTGWFAG